jgi:hypothetical protein
MGETVLFLYYHKQIEKKLREIGAVSEETAVKPEELKNIGLSRPHLNFLKSPLRRRLAQIARDNIRETSDGRYYIICEDGKHC